MILEVCAFNIQSCLIADKAGAARVELCADPLEGGTTPSYGLIQYALAHTNIPVWPMIRPRGGSYVFDDAEMAIILKDILVCRELGCPGIVTGVQLANGKIDTVQMKHIVDIAYPMMVSCHKVFDETPDAFEALDGLIEAGCVRVLTSGLQKTALEGAPLLAKLVKHSAGRITIMPGGTVRSNNIASLARVTGAQEFHSSGVISRGLVNFSDEAEVRQMVAALQAVY